MFCREESAYFLWQVPFLPVFYQQEGGGTTSFGESGQVVVLAVGAGVSAVGVTRGIEIVGGQYGG